jgi:hypothetical protein
MPKHRHRGLRADRTASDSGGVGFATPMGWRSRGLRRLERVRREQRPLLPPESVRMTLEVERRSALPSMNALNSRRLQRRRLGKLHATTHTSRPGPAPDKIVAVCIDKVKYLSQVGVR